MTTAASRRRPARSAPSRDVSGLNAEYAEPVGQSVNPLEFGLISGLSMVSQNLVLNFGTAQTADNRTFLAGITYRNVQVLDVMLGQNNDTFTVDATPVQPQAILGLDPNGPISTGVDDSITVIQGGGGNDTLIANGGGGPNSALILLGDTTQDGRFYNTTTAQLSVDAYAYICSVTTGWRAPSRTRATT